MKRRLAALMVGDIVGYSAMMERDEEQMADRLAACHALISEKVRLLEGRVFDTAGDAALAEFPSAVNAVRSALEIRRALAGMCAPENEPLRMRFGLHIADVVVQGDGLVGDGVNLAARIQAEAEPDSIYVSSALFDHIRRNAPFIFDDVGERVFKNISEPIRLYRVRGEIGADGLQSAPVQPHNAHRQRPASRARPDGTSTHLLERDHHLGLLHDLLADARGGHGRIAALTGEAGVGKTSLAHAFGETAPAGTRILRGACEDLAVREPLGPLQDLARDAEWDLDGAIARHERRLAVFSEALEVFNRADCATLLVVEDLHWADDATLDFVRFLGRRIRNARLLLLLTARDEAAGRGHLRRALADVPPDNVVRIDLSPLSEGAVADMARRSGMDGRAVFRTTSGNPFFVTELLRGGREQPAPASVQDAVLARADRLSDAARNVLDAVSVFPGRAEAGAVLALCGDAAETAVSECIAAGILQPADEGHAFRHELARRAIEDAMPAARRRELNARALAAARARPGTPLARMLHHARQAGDSAAVRELAPGAGREAAQVGAHAEAAEHFLAAVDHADSYPDDERIALYWACGHACYLAGRNVEAMSVQRKALELHRQRGDRLREGESLRWLSRFSYQLGDVPATRAYAEQAVDLLEGTDGPELAMAYSTLSQIAMLADDVEGAFRYGERAVAMAERLDLPDVLSHALNNIGHAGRWSDPPRSRRNLERSLDIALKISDHDHCGRAYVNLAWFDKEMLNLGGAMRTIEAGLAYCAEHELPAYGTYLRATMAEVLLRQGLWDRAETEATRVIQYGLPVRQSRFVATLPLARLRTRTGAADCGPLLDFLAEYLVTGKELQRFAPYASLVAERAWLGLFDRQDALRLIEEVEDMAPDPAMIADVIAWRRLLEPSRPVPDSASMPEPYRLLFAGDWQGAAEAWAGIGAPFEQGLALLEGGPDAQRQALALFESLGATAVAEHIRRLPQRRGNRGGDDARPSSFSRLRPAVS